MIELLLAFLKSPLTSAACLGNKPNFTGLVRLGMAAAVVCLPIVFGIGSWWAEHISDQNEKIITGIARLSDWQIKVNAENAERDRRLEQIETTHASKAHVQAVQRQVERLDERVLYLERRAN